MTMQMFVEEPQFERCRALTFPHVFMTRSGSLDAEGKPAFDGGVPFPFYAAYRQIHSTRIRYLTGGEREDWEGDGFVTDRPGLGIAVRTADCLPILMEDAQAGVIGAVHAGWRGTVAGIAPDCVRRMCEHGADAARITVAIGPCIHPECYEVGADFVAAVRNQRGETFAAGHIREIEGKNHADLPGMNRELLEEAGILPAHIFLSPTCTCCRTDRCFSFRGDAGRKGTMLAAIRIPET